ncbi:hypothetical protein [Arthrobacter sp. B0490]|uniref:hypothetical protein n=1 Tax=Arthrobacter sp. B0490 TaxID=2058891 RepID=UPI000CE46332|nr:hypothetical protein [Arthrobacter sp. B0490]
MQDGTDGGSTGDAPDDEILAGLDRLGDLPVSEHAGVYLDVLERLGRELNPLQGLRRAGDHGSP